MQSIYYPEIDQISLIMKETLKLLHLYQKSITFIRF